LWHEIIFPQTCNLFNKLLREIVILAIKPHKNETGLDKKIIWERRIRSCRTTARFFEAS